jgi:hypothetical protein
MGRYIRVNIAKFGTSKLWWKEEKMRKCLPMARCVALLLRIDMLGIAAEARIHPGSVSIA